MNIYIGADPGLSGGIAFVPEDGSAAWAEKMPDTDSGLLELLKDQAFEATCFGLIEKVHSMPKQGVTSAFTFGEGYGKLQMAFIAAGIPFDRCTPQKWQREMQCLTKGNKNVSKRRASELFPHIKCTHAISDALLIAEYLKRTHK